jgi:hypothetical protein
VRERNAMLKCDKVELGSTLGKDNVLRATDKHKEHGMSAFQHELRVHGLT